jgi:hypothetical protein
VITGQAINLFRLHRIKKHLSLLIFAISFAAVLLIGQSSGWLTAVVFGLVAVVGYCWAAGVISSSDWEKLKEN